MQTGVDSIDDDDGGMVAVKVVVAILLYRLWLMVCVVILVM